MSIPIFQCIPPPPPASPSARTRTRTCAHTAANGSQRLYPVQLHISSSSPQPCPQTRPPVRKQIPRSHSALSGPGSLGLPSHQAEASTHTIL